jgi:hypothetical protein
MRGGAVKLGGAEDLTAGKACHCPSCPLPLPSLMAFTEFNKASRRRTHRTCRCHLTTCVPPRTSTPVPGRTRPSFSLSRGWVRYARLYVRVHAPNSIFFFLDSPPVESACTLTSSQVHILPFATAGTLSRPNHRIQSG